jgi:hypothetical protein
MIPPALQRAERIMRDVRTPAQVAPLLCAADAAARRPYQGNGHGKRAVPACQC